MCRIELHSHTDVSNIRLRDALTKVSDLIQKAADMGLKGLAITDHESVGAHVKAIQAVRKKKEKGEIPSDFKLILGNEIYLVDSLEEVRDNYESGVTKFPHFLLLAKDAEGHEALRVLSSKAWSQSYYTGHMERVPTTKEDLVEVIGQYPNKLIGSSACLGSESSIHILNGDYDKAKDFLKWCSNLFGEGNFYLELQPGIDGEQRIVNEWLIKFSKELSLELIITNDVHYLRPEDASIHEAFLNSKEGDREVASFYSNTYLHTVEETYAKLSYIDKEVIDKALLNTIKIGEMIEDYTIERDTIIPKIALPEFKVQHIFKKGYDQYSYIRNMANSKDDQDRYYMSLIEKGFADFIPYNTITKERFHEYLSRIDVELEQLWKLSEKLKQNMSSYYVTIAKITSLIWGDDDCEGSRHEGSLVGAGRGSAVAWLTNYLTGITSVNPMEYGIEIPYWRHLSADMAKISSLDVDLDLNGAKKDFIFDRIKKEFGEDRFLQVCTYGTEGSKSAIQTACRGLGYDIEDAQYISSLIPFERGENYSISDCLYGNEEKGRQKVTQFINEIEKFPKLRETTLKIEGLINKRSVHAGGVLILNDHYTKLNALQKSPKGVRVTQFNLEDSQATGSIKYDLLTIESLEKIQTTMDLLLEYGEIEWQGSLRKTFNKYFHPEIIDTEDEALYELASSGTVPDLFQFSTQVGHNAIVKAQPKNLIEMTATNSLMRLQSKGEEQPIDTFIRFKEDISLWYDEMKVYGLNEEEVKVMEDHLLPLNGVADTQESVMMLAMDKRVATFNIADATELRKSIASKSDEVANAVKEKLFSAGLRQGTRKELLDYVWLQISRMLSYAFSSPHTLAYSLIACIQLNIVSKYNPIYWQTAVLTVNSGSQETEEGEKTKGTDYGKTASSIGKLRSLGVNVELPLINSANFSFTPDTINNRIVFSLKGITGIGDETVRELITNRPYNSFDDFYERMYLTKIIKPAQMIQLIKAGCFNEFFEGGQAEAMKTFLVKEVPVRDSLDGKNLPRIIKLGLFGTSDLGKYQEYFNFRAYLRKNVKEVINTPQNRILYIKDGYSQNFFNNNFSDESIVEYDNQYGILIDEKVFESEYKTLMKPAMELLKDKDFLRQFNIAQFRELWAQHATGTIPKWEMQAVSFYSGDHELDNVDKDKYGIVNFFDLEEEPVIESTYQWRGREMSNYKLSTIMGTVLDKDKNKHTITVLTPDGVVTVKQWGGSFSHYDKQIKIGSKVEEVSWFTRGNLLMLTGFRRGDMFRLKAPKGQHTINKITEIRNDGSLGLQSQRVRH